MLPKKPKTRYTQAMGLIAFAVGLYALINHLSVIGSVFHFLTDLLQPLIVGAILAFFLNVPMRGLEKLLLRLQTKRRWKVRERANEVISLIVTYVGGFLLIFLVLYIVIPQLVETIPGIISSAEAAWPRLIAFLQSHNINTQQLEQLFSNFDLGPCSPRSGRIMPRSFKPPSPPSPPWLRFSPLPSPASSFPSTSSPIRKSSSVRCAACCMLT